MSKRHRAARQAEGLPEDFRVLAKHMRTLARGVSAMLERDPAAESIAAADAEDFGWQGLGATRPGLESTLFPRMLLGSVVDHLHGAAACVSAEGALFSILSLLRPIIEASAAAYFLTDPGLERAERVRRWANYRLESLVESQRLTGEGTDGHFPQRIAAMTSRATELGMEVKVDANRFGLAQMRHIPPRIPSAMELSRQLLDDLTGVDAGGIIHRSTSAVIHGKMHGLLMIIVGEQSVPTSRPGVVQAPSGMSIRAMASWTSPAIWGIDRCVLRSCDYYGWPRQEWVRVVTPVLLHWRNLIAQPG